MVTKGQSRFFMSVATWAMIAMVTVFYRPAFAESGRKTTLQGPERPFLIDGQAKTGVREFLSDSFLSENTLYLRGGYQEKDTLAHQFMQQMTFNILKDISLIDEIDPMNPYGDNGSEVSEIYYYSMFEGEIRENNYIKQRLATGAIIDASMVFFEKSEAYRYVKRFEQTLSKYFIIELRRDLSSESATLYLPGKRPSGSKDKTLYDVSVSTLFYSSTDSFKGYYSLELKCFYLGTQACTLYDFGKNELKFRIENQSLDNFFSSNIDFTMIHDSDKVNTYVLKMLFYY